MKGTRRSASRNRERIEHDPLLRKLLELLWVYRGMVRATIYARVGVIQWCLCPPKPVRVALKR